MSILHEHTAAGSHFGVFKGRVTVLSFGKVEVLLPLQCFGNTLCLLVTGHSGWRMVHWGRHLRFLFISITDLLVKLIQSLQGEIKVVRLRARGAGAI